jgi:hypothetical protein
MTLDERPLDWASFFDRDPYDGFDPAMAAPDLQGWGSTHPIFAEVIKTLRPALICEVGTWKGASAIHMATICAALGIEAKIICIDTWLGGVESYTWKDKQPELHRDLKMINGWPQIYYTFMANVVQAGFTKTIIPLPQTSAIGARILKEMNIFPDVIYIDASHDYPDVKQDLAAYYELVRPGGVVFGDDFIDWPGVTQAVAEFAMEKKLALIGCAGKYALAKDADIRDVFRRAGRLDAGGEVAGLAPVSRERLSGWRHPASQRAGGSLIRKVLRRG